jgi:electron transfer flavoprotein beta subunit
VSYKIVVCIKQVPDTQKITGEAMKADGTVNRAALPAIFNPEDLNALEMALSLRDAHGGEVWALTMGPPNAAETLREALFRGADRAVLLTDRRFAASDTLATSYALSMAVRKIGDVDVVFCGRQAIDGDTAQIGPQLAEKLGWAQFTYVESLEVVDGKVRVHRSIEGGYEVLEGPLPILLTVTATANVPRPCAAKRMMRYKKARTFSEVEKETDEYLVPNRVEALKERGLVIEEWNADDVACDAASCGLSGSPTKVKKIESVKLVTTEHRKVNATQDGVGALVAELVSEHILG